MKMEARISHGMVHCGYGHSGGVLGDLSEGRLHIPGHFVPKQDGADIYYEEPTKRLAKRLRGDLPYRRASNFLASWSSAAEPSRVGMRRSTPPQPPKLELALPVGVRCPKCKSISMVRA